MDVAIFSNVCHVIHPSIPPPQPTSQPCVNIHKNSGHYPGALQMLLDYNSHQPLFAWPVVRVYENCSACTSGELHIEDHCIRTRECCWHNSLSSKDMFSVFFPNPQHWALRKQFSNPWKRIEKSPELTVGACFTKNKNVHTIFPMLFSIQH